MAKVNGRGGIGMGKQMDKNYCRDRHRKCRSNRFIWYGVPTRHQYFGWHLNFTFKSKIISNFRKELKNISHKTKTRIRFRFECFSVMFFTLLLFQTKKHTNKTNHLSLEISSRFYLGIPLTSQPIVCLI